jgi:hypothetical protein
MDPWLEQHWGGDLHQRMITYSCDQLEAQLPPGLYAAMEENVYFVEVDQRSVFRPDVSVFQGNDHPRQSRPAGGGAAAVAEPITIVTPILEVREGHIEIRDAREGNALVTAIEVLSNSNKLTAEGRAEYRRKRESYYRAGANVVEVDLLRAGPHVLGVPEARLTEEMRAPYSVCVTRTVSGERRFELYPLDLRQRLPCIGLPLRRGDQDIVFDLQQPLDLAYEKGRYGMRIDYGRPPEPPLASEDAAWAESLIRSTAEGVRP